MINKKILLLLAGGLMAHGVMQAQSEMTAVTLANAEESNGSARYQALSGAMGAVGVDFSSVAQNPAGIALLRRNSRVDLTLGYTFDKAHSKWYDNTSMGKKNSFNFDQISANFKIGSGVNSWTFGIALRNTGRTNRVVDAFAENIASHKGTSLADYAVANLNNIGDDAPNPQRTYDAFNRSTDPFIDFPWISTLGIRADWVAFTPKTTQTETGPNGQPITKTYPAQFITNYNYEAPNGDLEKGYPNSAGLYMEETISIREADFAFGVNLGSRVNLGFLIASTSLDYTMHSSYSEGFRPSEGGNGFDGLSLDNNQYIKGVGAKFGLGVLAEPINGLRLGASIYTPTFYKFDYDFDALATGHSPITPIGKTMETRSPERAATTFRLKTPWRFGLNGAYIIKHYGLISMDYEFSTFGGTRLSEDVEEWDSDNYFSKDNNALSDDFKGIHRLRIGTEFNVNKRLALRAGAKFESSPVDNPMLDQDEPKQEVFVTGSMVHYMLPKGKYGLSAGLGYRITPKWSLDCAYVYNEQKSSIYAFPAIGDNMERLWLKGLKPIKHTDKQHRVLLTLGFRF